MAPTSQNIIFPFMKRAHDRTLLEGFWVAVVAVAAAAGHWGKQRTQSNPCYRLESGFMKRAHVRTLLEGFWVAAVAVAVAVVVAVVAAVHWGKHRTQSNLCCRLESGFMKRAHDRTLLE